MALDFMKPDVWDGLVLGVVLIGAALAVLRLISDWSLYQQRRRQAQERSAAPEPPTAQEDHTNTH